MKIKNNLIPNKDTKVFASAAIRPGLSGSYLHNNCFKIFNMNAIYLPIQCNTEKELKELLKIKKISGISISMPFKSSVIKYLDNVEKISKLTNSVNTVHRKSGKLFGYNTDYYGAKKIISKINITKKSNVLLLGNGSVARVIYEILKEKKVNKIYLCSRNLNKYKNWKIRKSDQKINWKLKESIKSNLMVNATSIGMKGTKQHNFFHNKKIKNFENIFDLTINDKSLLKKNAKINKIKFYGGKELSFYQGVKQFNIYNNLKISEKLIAKKLNFKF